MATTVFDGGLRDLTSGAPSGGVPWVSNVYKLTLVTSAYAVSAGELYASQFSGFELSTASFTAGFGGLMRRTISSRAATLNATSHYMALTGDPVTWSGISAGAVGAIVLLRESGTDALSPVVAYYPVVNVVTAGGDLIVSAPASGFLVVSTG